MAPRINFKHKKEVPFEERVRESQRVRERHAERVPVIVEKAPSSDIPSIDKCALTLHPARRAPVARCPRYSPACHPCVAGASISSRWT